MEMMQQSGNNDSSPVFLIIAGEPSGDLHGAGFVRALKNRFPGCSVFGIGGEKMCEEGVEILFHVEKMAVLGFAEVIKHLPFIRKVFDALISEVENRKPDAVILIDYPGFNVRIAKKLRKRFGRKLKILYYISPQVWAWKRKRIQTIAENIDAMAVVFPFEEELYREAGVNVRFVGHPLLDCISPSNTKAEFFSSIGLNPEKTTIGLLPGSRVQEIRRHLPHMLGAINILKNEISDLQAVIGKMPHIPEENYNVKCAETVHAASSEDAYDIMQYCTLLLVSSGTATLEAGLYGTPMVIIYRMSTVTYFIARRLVTLPFIGLVNIVHGKKVVPELIQSDATPEKIAGAASRILSDHTIYSGMQNTLKHTSSMLGSPRAPEKAVEFLCEIL